MIKTNPTPPTPIIQNHYSTVQVIEPPKRVLIEKEICTRLDGCPIVNNVCVDCLTVKNQWGLLGDCLTSLVEERTSIPNILKDIELKKKEERNRRRRKL